MMNKFIITFLITLALVINISSAETYEAFAKIVGVDSQGRGIVGNITVEIQTGKGRVLVDTTPLQGIYTQDSERSAVKVANDITNFDFSNYDVIYNIVTMSANSVEGPSAGGVMALATIAAIQDKQLSPYFSMTGTINDDHSIGKVGGILAKVKAAADSGITLFLIPKGESIQYQYIKQTKTPAPGWRIETIEPVEVNVTELAKEWGTDVHEVLTIEEAMKYAFEMKPLPGNVTRTRQLNVEAMPSFNTPVQEYKEFSPLVSDEMLRAQRIYRETRKKLSETVLPDDVKGALDELLKRSETYSADSNKIFNRGYIYSAGNNAFKSIITSKTVSDLVDYQNYPVETRQDFLQRRLNEARNKINETVNEFIYSGSSICDAEKFEWTVGSRQRLLYAEQRLNDVSSQTASNPFSILFDINTAGEWLEISNNFKSKTDNSKEECEAKFKELADQRIADALNEMNNVQQLGIKDLNDAKFYINTAKRAYELKWYVNSIYDATNAKTRASVVARYDGKSMKEVYSDFNNTFVETSGLLSTIFLENSQYTMYTAIKENDEFLALDALTLLSISKNIENVTNTIQPILPKNAFKMTLPSVGDVKTLLIITFVSTGILIIVFVLYAISIKKDLQRLEEKYLEIQRRMKRKNSKKLVGKKKK